MGVSPARARDIDAALVEFYSAGLDATSLVDRTFALTSRLLSSSLHSHGVLDHQTGVLSAHFDTAPAGIESAFASFGRLMGNHRAFSFDPTFHDGRPYSVLGVYGAPGFRDLDIHHDVYRPMRLDDHCFMHVPADSRSTVFIGLLRDGRGFDDDELAVLARLQPHLANGRKLAMAVTMAMEIPITPELFEHAGFTPRECDVLCWLARGKSNEEIASLLHLRADSVSRHLQSTYVKMGVEHRVAATIVALQLARQLHAESQVVNGRQGLLAVGTR